MKIRSKYTLYLLAISLIPLLLAMSLTLGYTSEQVEDLTLQSAQARVQASAENLSGYFSARISEVRAYAQSPLVSSMQWIPMREFLRAEVEFHDGIYEKFILGLPSSHFRNTVVGNPALDHLASFDDKDESAKLKSIRKRGYWQALVGTNQEAVARTHVSNPMISYTTGVKQVVVGASVLSADNKLAGMLGGAIPWDEIENKLNMIRDGIISDYGKDVKISLVDNEGIYIYHWDPERVIHLVLDDSGKPVLNEIGEKTVVLKRITEEQSGELASAGRQLLKGKRGIVFYNGDENKDNAALYAPVESSDYGLIMTIPKSVILSPVSNLRHMFFVLLVITVIVITFLAWLSSRRALKNMLDLHRASQAIAKGNYHFAVDTKGGDEVSELAVSFNTMAKELDTREHSMQKALQRAEEANKEKSRFLSNMSHELRTPMHAIMGFTDASLKVIGDSNDKVTGYLQNIRLSSTRLTGLLNNLLDLAKLESGKTTLCYANHDLFESTREVIRELESLIDEKRLSINIEQTGSLSGEFDLNLMHQVIVNLVSNAIKFSYEGGNIVIRLKQDEKVLQNVSMPVLHFSIEDYGVGIPADELDTIFDAFTQSSKTLTNAGGTGLGLPICREIIHFHRGQIWTTSPVVDPANRSEGDTPGSTFEFVIPVHEIKVDE